MTDLRKEYPEVPRESIDIENTIGWLNLSDEMWDHMMGDVQDLLVTAYRKTKARGNTNTVELVVFSCGCIGSKPDAHGCSNILNACDGEGGVGMHARPMGEKDYKPVAPDYIDVIRGKYVEAENAEHMRHAIRVLLAEGQR